MEEAKIAKLLNDSNKWTPGKTIYYSPSTGKGTIIIKIPLEALSISDPKEDGYHVRIEIKTIKDVEMTIEQLKIYIGDYKKANKIVNQLQMEHNEIDHFIYNHIIKLPVDLHFTEYEKEKLLSHEEYNKKLNGPEATKYIYFTSSFKLRNLLLCNACIPTKIIQNRDLVLKINSYRKLLCLKDSCVIFKGYTSYSYTFSVTKEILELVKEIFPDYNYRVTILGNRGELNSGLFICFCSLKDIHNVRFDLKLDVDELIKDDRDEFPNFQLAEKFITFMILFNRDVYICDINTQDMYVKEIDFSEFVKSDIEKKEIELNFPATEMYLWWKNALEIQNSMYKAKVEREANNYLEIIKTGKKRQKIIENIEVSKKLEIATKKADAAYNELILSSKNEIKTSTKKKNRKKKKRKKHKKIKNIAAIKIQKIFKNYIATKKFMKKYKKEVRKQIVNSILNIILDQTVLIINRNQTTRNKIKTENKRKKKQMKKKILLFNNQIIKKRYFNVLKNFYFKVKAFNYFGNRFMSILIKKYFNKWITFSNNLSEVENLKADQVENIEYIQPQNVQVAVPIQIEAAPECKFGFECRRTDCFFNHSNGRRIDVCPHTQPLYQYQQPYHQYLPYPQPPNYILHPPPNFIPYPPANLIPYSQHNFIPHPQPNFIPHPQHYLPVQHQVPVSMEPHFENSEEKCLQPESPTSISEYNTVNI